MGKRMKKRATFQDEELEFVFGLTNFGNKNISSKKEVKKGEKASECSSSVFSV